MASSENDKKTKPVPHSKSAFSFLEAQEMILLRGKCFAQEDVDKIEEKPLKPGTLGAYLICAFGTYAAQIETAVVCAG
ncbi:MAG TPA: hypothetical protein VNE63_22845 [Candidatus Acidoferrales bacterium]|nr:hypothetical protein [Candidatus Acidoferrales bacterium]